MSKFNIGDKVSFGASDPIIILAIGSKRYFALYTFGYETTFDIEYVDANYELVKEVQHVTGFVVAGEGFYWAHAEAPNIAGTVTLYSDGTVTCEVK